MRLEDLMNEVNLKIESLHEYYDSQIDLINKKVYSESKKYELGVTIDRYIFSRVNEIIDDTENNEGNESFNLAENYVYDIKFEADVDGVLKVYYKMKDVEKLKKQGIEVNPMKARKGLRKLLEMPNFLNNSTLLALIIVFEETISGIFECLINKYPNAYLKDKTMTYSQLLEMDTNIESLKDFLIKKEVEEIMRQNINYWYDLLNKNHKINLEILNDYYDNFIEIYYRRNIIVHNNGIVNNTYLQGVNNTDLKSGQSLHIDKEYMEKAFINTYIIIYGTFFVITRIHYKMLFLKLVFSICKIRNGR